MKALTILCALVLCICWAAFAAPAETVTVHFANPVIVGETTLPAGNVSIDVLHGSNSIVLAFRSESGVTVSAVANRISDFRDDRAGASVDLSHQGNTYKVERVWLDDHSGFALLDAGR